MHIDLLTGEELPKLWAWITAEKELHFGGLNEIKSVEEFAQHLIESKITVFAVRTGRKLVGAVGFQAETLYFRGIHFDKAVRGTGLAHKALREILDNLHKLGAESIKAATFAHNPYVPSFFAKLGAKSLSLPDELMKVYEFNNQAAKD